LLHAISHCPSILLPQVVILSNAFEPRRREVITYRFNEELLDAWFAEKKVELLRMIQDLDLESPSPLEPNALAYLRAAKEEATRLTLAAGGRRSSSSR
jgi:hypothetical protein